jgi:hypothetical protein
VSIREHTSEASTSPTHILPLYLVVVTSSTRTLLVVSSSIRFGDERVADTHSAAVAVPPPHTSAYVSICQHTSAYVSIQHTSAYVSIRHTPGCMGVGGGYNCVPSYRHNNEWKKQRIQKMLRSKSKVTSAYVSVRQHASAYVSIRQHTSAYVSVPVPPPHLIVGGRKVSPVQARMVRFR